jgi:2,3-bisphosphoglycerate-independent phosphoglycerate mutase
MINSILLIILDGWGIAPPGPGNAIAQANTPNFNKFFTSYPHALLTASGEQVGLPRGEVGNTETGHLNIGAGQIVYQDLPRINMSIADGTFFRSPALLAAKQHIQKNQSQLHIMGLVGPGGVHSKLEHLLALIRFCQENNINNIAVHAFTDGRDSPPVSSQIYLDQIQAELEKHQIGHIASITGRYYAMDRDNRWDRTEKTYHALTKGEGKTAPNHTTAINLAYQRGQTDEFIEPTIITNPRGEPKSLIKNKDAVIFFNFRIDRPRQLTKAFILDPFTHNTIKTGYDPYHIKYFGKHQPEQQSATVSLFLRGPKLEQLYFITMTEYEKNLPVDDIILPPLQVKMPLGRIISQKNWRQLRAAESEKERFVTYYFNGQREKPFPGEERLIVPSPKIYTYDQQPEMSAHQLTEAVIQKLTTNQYRLTVVNFANADMVGHTGNLQASIKAVETIDHCIGKLVKFALSRQGICIITADHGNAESMINPRTGEPDTEHSSNHVPFIYIANQINRLRNNLGSGILADIAPTLLSIAGIPKPSSMTGKNLLG